MKRIKTARGQILDMQALAARHDRTRAISNVPINARGDVIDNRGEIKVTREEVSKSYNANTVVGVTDTISIKEDIKEEVVETNLEMEIPTTENEVVSRTEREREDGSKYFEVEYSDGSMAEEESNE